MPGDRLWYFSLVLATAIAKVAEFAWHTPQSTSWQCVSGPAGIPSPTAPFKTEPQQLCVGTHAGPTQNVGKSTTSPCREKRQGNISSYSNFRRSDHLTSQKITMKRSNSISLTPRGGWWITHPCRGLLSFPASGLSSLISAPWDWSSWKK